MRLYRHVKHVANEIDRGVLSATRFYGEALRPALLAAGYDTRDTDSRLLKVHSEYGAVRDRLEQGFRVGDGVIAHMHNSATYGG